jgi:hypothetical protein
MLMTDLDQRIKRLCEQKGITFKPWQFPQRPWNVEDDEPNTEPSHTVAYTWHKQCVALRAALKAELAEADRK